MIRRHASIDPVHPGEILREDILPALSMSKTAVAKSLGISRQTLYDILNEKQPVTVEMVVRLGKPLGNGAGFRVNLQRSHDPTIVERPALSSPTGQAVTTIARQPAHAPR